MAKKSEQTVHKSTEQLFNFADDSYFERTSRPVYAVFFLLPFIIFYEIGTIFINTNLLSRYWRGRVIAFDWLARFLEFLGFNDKTAWIGAPLAVIIILIALQMMSRKKWSFDLRDIVPMGVECTLWSVPLIVLSLFLNNTASPVDSQQGYSYASKTLYVCQAVDGNAAGQQVSVAADDKKDYLLANIVTAIGAGIYEELVFRLILICLLMIVLQDLLRFEHRNAIMLSILISAALFSAHHHVDFLTGSANPTEPFNMVVFGFRTMAGVYFAALFSIRGFAITAGTHAFYDIIVVVMNTYFFGG